MASETQQAELEALAARALDCGEEGAAVVRLGEWLARHPRDSLVAHWQGLLLRALDRRGDALALLAAASQREPGNAATLHALAHVTLEAGLPAAALFEAAIALAPANGAARLGLASARFAEGQGLRAMDELAETLAANPGWLDGHRCRAQLAAMLGETDEAFATIDHALRTNAHLAVLHQLKTELLLEAEDHAGAVNAARHGMALVGNDAPLALLEAAALDELGENAAAAAFTRLGPARESGHAVRRLRHLLRRGQLDSAARELEPWLGVSADGTFWSYAALVWRARSDPRAHWLEDQAGLVSVIELDPGAQAMADLARLLRRLHSNSGRFLDQSVRHGTQTDGPLLARIDPEITVLRALLVDAVGGHIAQLPGHDTAHPLLARRRDRPVRFAGSWSVGLAGAGHHTSHHHPQGWISSAFYAAVPDAAAPGEGVLELGGSPPGLGLDLGPRQIVQPRPGRLVLFPSFMWHATTPFGTGERISVAFDVAVP